MVGPAAKREAAACLRDEFQMSERRACKLIEADRKMVLYRSTRPPETALRTRLRELANERRRFGYRRLFILLRREGEPSGINRIYRLYREEGLGVRRRKGRKRSGGVRAPILVEAKPNARPLSVIAAQSPVGQGDRSTSCMTRWPMAGGSGS